MNSIVLDSQNELIEDEFVLKHIQDVLKSSVGDTIKCTILNHGLVDAKIIELHPHKCLVKFSLPRAGLKPWFNLIVGVSRPQTTKKILEHATTFGAHHFHFFKAELSEKSYLTSSIFQPNEMKNYLTLGLSQSAYYYTLPLVETSLNLPLNQFKEGHAQNFILDLKGEETFLDSSIDFSLPINLAFGPERGWTKSEIERFHEANFKSIKISSSVLRVEHAIYSAISQLELLKLNRS